MKVDKQSVIDGIVAYVEYEAQNVPPAIKQLIAEYNLIQEEEAKT